MAEVTARIKIKGKHFEVQVNLDEALKIKAGKGDITAVSDTFKVFSDIKKGGGYIFFMITRSVDQNKITCCDRDNLLTQEHHPSNTSLRSTLDSLGSSST